MVNGANNELIVKIAGLLKSVDSNELMTFLEQLHLSEEEKIQLLLKALEYNLLTYPIIKEVSTFEISIDAVTLQMLNDIEGIIRNENSELKDLNSSLLRYVIVINNTLDNDNQKEDWEAVDENIKATRTQFGQVGVQQALMECLKNKMEFFNMYLEICFNEAKVIGEKEPLTLKSNAISLEEKMTFLKIMSTILGLYRRYQEGRQIIQKEEQKLLTIEQERSKPKYKVIYNGSSLEESEPYVIGDIKGNKALLEKEQREIIGTLLEEIYNGQNNNKNTINLKHMPGLEKKDIHGKVRIYFNLVGDYAIVTGICQKKENETEEYMKKRLTMGTIIIIKMMIKEYLELKGKATTKKLSQVEQTKFNELEEKLKSLEEKSAMHYQTILNILERKHTKLEENGGETGEQKRT